MCFSLLFYRLSSFQAGGSLKSRNSTSPIRSQNLEPLLSIVPNSETTAAHAVIPSGIVYRVRQDLDRQISDRMYDKARFYISRVRHKADSLMKGGCTCTDALEWIQRRGLAELDSSDTGFLRDWLNLQHVVIRGQQTVDELLAAEDVDVLFLIHRRGLNIRNHFWFRFYNSTCTDRDRISLMQDTFFITEFGQCAELLKAEVIRLLTRMQQQRTSWSEVELENVGPDHDVNDYGCDSSPVSSALDNRDDNCRCCICLEPYTAAHTALKTTACNHLVGKPCLSRWLNGTTLNANTCPKCRRELFERRALRPATLTDESSEHLDTQLTKAIDLLGKLERLRNELFGPSAAAGFIEPFVDEVNYHFFQNDISFSLSYGIAPVPRLGVRETEWHTMDRHD